MEKLTPLEIVFGLVAVIAVCGYLVWLVNKAAADKQKALAHQAAKANILDLAIVEYILKLQVENRQLRELLNLRAKDEEGR